MNRSQSFKFTLIALAFVLLLGLAACGPQGYTETATLEAIATQPEAVIETEAPTPTVAAPAVIVVISPETDPELGALIQTAVGTLAPDAGLEVLTYDALTPEMIHPGVQVVVGVGTDLTALAVGAPAVQFVTVNQPGAVAGANLSVIGDPLLDEQRKAFMAGYLTALVSSDYKVAGLIASDLETTTDEVNAYVIGARFFCGLCNPKYPPYNSFPQWEVLPSGSAAGAYQPIADNFVALGVEVVYAGETLVSPELSAYLSGLGLKIVGGKAPDMPYENWVGTVVLDPTPSLAALWPDLLAGTGGQALPMSVALMDTGAGLISEGRQRLFDEMLVDLEAGDALPEFTP